jgi:hypothetical protein
MCRRAECSSHDVSISADGAVAGAACEPGASPEWVEPQEPTADGLRHATRSHAETSTRLARVIESACCRKSALFAAFSTSTRLRTSSPPYRRSLRRDCAVNLSARQTRFRHRNALPRPDDPRIGWLGQEPGIPFVPYSFFCGRGRQPRGDSQCHLHVHRRRMRRSLVQGG